MLSSAPIPATYADIVTFSLHIDAELWRSGLKARQDGLAMLFDASPQAAPLVPVIEGGYCGLDPVSLAVEARHLDVTTLAVGSAFDANRVAEHFPGEILVRQPWDPRDLEAMREWGYLDDGLLTRVIRVVASSEALQRLAAEPGPPVPVVLAGVTSAYGAGLAEPELDALLADDALRDALRSGRVVLRGASLQMPVRQPSSPQVSTIGGSRAAGALPSSASNRAREAWGWAVIWIRALAAVEQSHIPLTQEATTIWVSGLDDGELQDLHSALDLLPIRVLMAEELWWGNPEAFVAYGSVLGVHPVTRGREVGLSQRRAPRDGYVVVVSGGSSHGLGTAKARAAGLRERASHATNSAMTAWGRARSPFVWAGRERRFLEAPHETYSLLWLSESDVHEALTSGHRTPSVGDQWSCRPGPHGYRYDRVLGLD